MHTQEQNSHEREVESHPAELKVLFIYFINFYSFSIGIGLGVGGWGARGVDMARGRVKFQRARGGTFTSIDTVLLDNQKEQLNRFY